MYVSMCAFAHVHSVVTLGQEQGKGRANNRTYSVTLVIRKMKIKIFSYISLTKVKKSDNI